MHFRGDCGARGNKAPRKMAGGNIKRPRQISLMEGDLARDGVLSVGMALELDAECLGGVSCLAGLAVEVGLEAESPDV